MKNPFRSLTLTERLAVLTQEKIDELLYAELAAITARANITAAREKLLLLRNFPGQLLAVAEPRSGLPVSSPSGEGLEGTRPRVIHSVSPR
jgi:hypothetical protein